MPKPDGPTRFSVPATGAQYWFDEKPAAGQKFTAHYSGNKGTFMGAFQCMP
jgi:hypothetical protein